MKIGDARLLLVTDPRPDLVDRVEAAVRGGVDIVPLAEELKDAGRRAGARFTVNDDVELARLVGADGVHLSEDDAPTPYAHGVLGPGAVVGRSARSVDVALEAIRGAQITLASGRSLPPRQSLRARWPGLP